MYAVRLLGLTKDFRVGFWRPRQHRALDDVTLDVKPGEVLGYLGPNGSGKTTTLKLLMQLVFPTSGRAEVLGRPVGDVATRRRVGFLPESPHYYDNLTAEELLRYAASLCGHGRADADRRATEFLDRVGVQGERRMRLRTLSKGMLQRVGIAQALVADPELLFLDEPMSGLDPIGRRDVRTLILPLRDEGRTLFFSSHILSDAEALCNRVAILSRGRLVASGRISDLGLKIRGWELVIAGVSDTRIETIRPLVDRVTRVADGRWVLDLPIDRPPEHLIRDLAGSGARILSLTPHHETLEEFFVQRVGQTDAHHQIPA